MSGMKPQRRAVELAWPDETIDQVFREMFRDFFGAGMPRRPVRAWSSLMHVEEYIEDGTCVIRAELPGIDPDKDVELEVGGGMLRVAAKREERKEEERPSAYHSEFHYGSFERTLRLPEGASEADVTASYKDGILEIRVPIATVGEKSPTRVPIKHS